MNPDDPKDFKDLPLSESSVSLKLADIQKRCSELLAEPDAMADLTLEEPVIRIEGSNPYDRG